MTSKKKILLLAPPNSIHTIKWANEIFKRGFDVTVFGLSASCHSAYLDGIEILSFQVPTRFINYGFGSIVKLYYLLSIPKLIKVIKSEKPDIIHAHYASSYGLLGSLVNFHPFIVSVWGDDVFSFPKQSFIHKSVFKFILKRTDCILSTSYFMACEIKKYSAKEIVVIPFGVDTEVFKPTDIGKRKFEGIVIGTIKGLEFQYGIDFLIKTFNFLVNKHPKLPLQLLIVGKGSLENQLKELGKNLGIEDKIIFTGHIDNSEISAFHNMIDIFISLSIESFGVSVIEAQSCGKPVVVSNKGGVPEVIENCVTGFAVPRKDLAKVSDAIEKLIFDLHLRREMGNNGRKRVLENYEINLTVDKMILVYKQYILE